MPREVISLFICSFIAINFFIASSLIGLLNLLFFGNGFYVCLKYAFFTLFYGRRHSFEDFG